jgi:hypothetical protein
MYASEGNQTPTDLAASELFYAQTLGLLLTRTDKSVSFKLGDLYSLF